jgi:hypothetical protein
MRFKTWLEGGCSGMAVGGMLGIPTGGTNANMGIRSRWTMTDTNKDPNEKRYRPNRLFGFTTARREETQAQNHRYRKGGNKPPGFLTTRFPYDNSYRFLRQLGQNRPY